MRLWYQKTPWQRCLRSLVVRALGQYSRDPKMILGGDVFRFSDKLIPGEGCPFKQLLS